MKTRLGFVFLFIFLGWISLLSRAFYLQILPNEKLNNLKKRQFETVLTTRSQRGMVLDKYGRELAVTLTSYSLYANPQYIKDPKNSAKKISRLLKISFNDLYKKLSNKNKYFFWIKRQLSKKEKEKVQALGIKGFHFLEEPKRFYPNERLFSQVLGFVGNDDKGLEGLEFQYDSFLKGSKKKIRQLRDAKGRPLLLDGYFLTKDARGATLYLTLDSKLQFVLERELEKSIQKHQAKSALGVILDAQTSEVLAMANVPGYDVNKPLDVSSYIRKNRVVTDAFEPGSTLKSFIIAEALERNILKPNTLIDCENGELIIGKHIIREAGKKRYKMLSVIDILKYSSNIGISKIAFMLKEQGLKESLKKFGFSSLSGIDFPGEGRGVLQKGSWHQHLLSNISFGHGMTATALQIANAYASIANGGFLKKPKIVKKIESQKLKKTINKEDFTRVLSSETAETMRLMLMESAPKVAYIKGFPVAGKTGTAQKVDFLKGGYKKDAYLSSFSGFVPAYEPKFVVYILIDEPRKAHYGSQVAAPCFFKVASYAVRKEGLNPILIGEENILKTKKIDWTSRTQKKAFEKLKKMAQKEKLTHAPDLIGLSLREVYQRIHGSDIKLLPKGSGFVVKMYPQPHQKIPRNRRIKIFLR